MAKREIFIGTSGWMYKHWGVKFYPRDIGKSHLQFYSKEFKTVEINSTFYRMPNLDSFSKWQKETPSDFKFAIKLNQYITHRKRLIIDEKSGDYLKAFLKHTQELREKLCVILIQLPPSFKKNPQRLNSFFEFYSKQLQTFRYAPLAAIEFRHPSWEDKEVLEILTKFSVAFVTTSTPNISKEHLTSSFSYIRMHGDAKHSSKYKSKELISIKEAIDKYPEGIKKVFIYFNNDYSAYAIDNARFLISLFNKSSARISSQI